MKIITRLSNMKEANNFSSQPRDQDHHSKGTAAEALLE